MTYEGAQHERQSFKWIKQHLRIQRFLGTRERSETQIWCTLSTYVLIAMTERVGVQDYKVYSDGYSQH